MFWKKKSNKVVATVALTGIVSIGAFYNHTSKEIDANTEAAIKVDQVVKSECFEKEWMNSKLDETQTNGLTKRQVLNLILSSKTTIELEMYRSWVSTVGYTHDGVNKIWMNRKFHDGFSVCEKASNLFHETLHKLGLTHDVKATARRPYSPPYMGGTVLAKCCEN